MQQDSIVPGSGPASNGNQPVSSGSPKHTSYGIFSTIFVVFGALLIAFTLTAYVFQSYQVDGPSMQTTLDDQDRMIVWKVPRTLSRITHHTYIPSRYEIVIFSKDGLLGPGDKRQIIKRVIGLPGERVLVNDGKVTVFNKEHPDGFNPDEGQSFSNNIIEPTPGNVDLVVPEGEIFVCGDNRLNSEDSRYFGTISGDDIVGRLAFRVFPFNKFEYFATSLTDKVL